MLLIPKPPNESVPYKCFNIGNGSSRKLVSFLNVIEDYLQIKAKINYLPLQKGDIHKTHASIKKLYNKINYIPKVSINKGVEEFIIWYKRYFK